MAVPTATTQAVSRVGIREDLADMIYSIAPTETPFVQAIKKGKVSNVNTEWQTDTLASADPENANIQGDDVGNDTRAATIRLGNYTQLMDKVVGTSSTARASNTAGRADEHAYQIAQSMKELKRDMEAAFTGNRAAVPPAAGTAGKSAGALAFMRTNVSRGSGGANPTLSGSTTGYPNAAATNGTTRAFTETLLKTVLQSVWTAGGDPTMVLMGGSQKVAASAFAGLAQQRRETGNKRATIVGAADVYVSDWGEVSFVADRFCSTRDALIVDPEFWEIGTLQPLKREALAKTGHAERDMISVEHTLKCLNDGASGVVADLT